MKWENNRQSDNIEDRRNESGGMGGMFGGGAPRRVGGRGIGFGTIVIALLASWIFGINPLTVLGVLGGGGELMPDTTQTAPAPSARTDKPDDEMGRFVSSVLAGTEDVWTTLFQQSGSRYEAPHMVLYRGVTPTACGTGQSAMGPFYCPGDQKVYIDLAFYDTMKRQLGAPGDFAQAYVIAHEVGHHVQNLTGISEKVEKARQRLSEREYNALSVRLELQADCYAGIWAHHSQQAKNWLEQGDIESAVNAAEQIGDDALQRQQTGTVRPDAFTHGSSAQRVRWFTQGFKTGSVQGCNTFNAQSL